MDNRLFHNTGALSIFLLRRDRIRIPIWLLSFVVLTVTVTKAFTDLYATESDRQAIAETMKNPVMAAMIGRGYGFDNYTNGAMMAHQMLLFTGLAVAIMCILLVARHTRIDEEEGRNELIRSLPIGRLSNLSATLFVMLGVNMVLSLLIGFGLYALGIKSMNLEGSLLYGFALGAIGLFFTAITAVFAQVSENSRGTIGLSFAILGVFYLVRAVGDAGNEMVSWFSPLGWVLGAEVYVNNYWWPIFLTVGASIIISILALYLNAIRDLESGFISTKPGRNYASSFLQSPLGLAVRLQRTGLIAWAVGMFVIGASFGSVLGDLESFFLDNEVMKNLIQSTDRFSLLDQFMTMLMSIMAMISTIPAVMTINKPLGEEKKNRVEHLLARAVSRTHLMGSSLVVSIVTSFVMLLLSTIGLWFASGAVMEEGLEIRVLFSAAIVYLPAMWIMLGLAVLFIGCIPRLTGLTWLYLLYTFIVVYLGGLLQFPEWLSNLSPFGHIPKIPVEEMDFIKIIVLTTIATVMIFVGFIGYNKRDISS